MVRLNGTTEKIAFIADRPWSINSLRAIITTILLDKIRIIEIRINKIEAIYLRNE